jgi:hypothetical protein
MLAGYDRNVRKQQLVSLPLEPEVVKEIMAK